MTHKLIIFAFIIFCIIYPIIVVKYFNKEKGKQKRINNNETESTRPNEIDIIARPKAPIKINIISSKDEIKTIADITLSIKDILAIKEGKLRLVENYSEDQKTTSYKTIDFGKYININNRKIKT